MKSIVILTTHYPPPFSGAAVRAWNLVKNLSNLDEINKIYIVELSRRSMSPRTYFKKEYIYTANNGLLRIMRIIGINDLFYLKDIKPSIVIATLPPSIAIKVGTKTYYGTNIPILCDIQDVTDEYKLSITTGFRSILYRTYYTNVYKSLKLCSQVYTVTEAMAKVIEYKTGIAPIVAPNGSDPSLYEVSYYKYKDKSPCSPYCSGIFVGNLDWEYQKIDSIIKAIYVLKRKYNKKIYLKIIGKGKLLKYYMDIVRSLNLTDLVKFYGYVSMDRLPDLVSSSDFGIVSRPSIKNTWIMSSMRMTIYDYLSAGIPILAYGPPYSYTKNFIMKHKVGIYIPSDDPNIIANYILKDLHVLLSIRRDHCRKIGEDYRWENTLSPLIEFIKTMY